MCVIERKTYFHTNGKQETIEKTRPCHRAVGGRLCKHVERRSFEAARVVETKPSTVDRKPLPASSTSSPANRTSSDGNIFTEGFRGQQRMYRDLSNRSSNSSFVRRSATMSDRSPPSSAPSSASSPSYVEVKPAAPSPPPAAPGFAFGERTRAPYPPLESQRTVNKDGTAVYDRPPSLGQPRAFDNERPRSKQLDRESSFSSTTAEVDEFVEPKSTQRRHKPSISVDTALHPSMPSPVASGTFVSPGLSQLPRTGSLRRDPGKEGRRHSTRKRESDGERQRRKDREAASEAEDRQARLERDRLAESDRRQSAREELARQASRERHRRAAADALAGRHESDSSSPDAEEANRRGREAELAEMERERENAQQRKREDDLYRQYQYTDDQLRRDAEARTRYDAVRPSSSSGRTPSYPHQPKSSSPLSARQPISARAFGKTTTAMQPRVHQDPAVPHRDSESFARRGHDVIARAQARDASRRLGEAVGSRERDRGDEEDADEVYYREGLYRRDGEGQRRYR